MLQGPPEPFDEHVIPPRATAIHADFHTGSQQDAGEAIRGELTALVGVEDLRFAIATHGFFQCLDAERLVHGVTQTPGENLATPDVHDGHKVSKTTGHGKWSKKRLRASPPRTVRAPLSAYGSLFNLGVTPSQ